MNYELRIMKTRFLFLIIITIGVFCCRQAQAQGVSYGYDAAGNRISRVITMPPLRSSKSEPTGEEKVYSEVLKDFTVNIYPNPTKGDLTVEIGQLPEGRTASLLLYNLQGKLILQRTGLHDGSEHLNIGAQPAGIYLMKIATQDSSTEWKIIKK